MTAPAAAFKGGQGDARAGDAYHQMALTPAAHKDDPDFCSASVRTRQR